MARIVQKYGAPPSVTSTASRMSPPGSRRFAAKATNSCRRLRARRRDERADRAREGVCANPSEREMDQLLSIGDRRRSPHRDGAHGIGVDAVSYTGAAGGIFTDRFTRRRRSRRSTPSRSKKISRPAR